MTQKGSVEERRRLVAQSLQVGNPGNNARELSLGSDARGGPDQFAHQIELTIDEIRPYEGNPRRSTNARFDDIKESIRTSGLKSPLTVTRRPGESHYIIEAGGNTRLLVLQQLWAETRDPRYRQLTVLFRPWRSESHVLSAHLIENDLRGDMSFWDKACGVVALKERLEAEQGRVLALRPLEDVLHAMGLAVNPATLGLYLFATQRLRTLGEAIVGLAGLDVKGLQPRLNALKRYAQSRGTTSEDALYEQVFEPVFRRIADKYPHSEEFSVAATCEACEVALAAHLGESVDVLRDQLRPSGAKGEPETAPALVAGNAPPADAGLPRAAGQDATANLAGPRDLTRCVQALAEAAGLADHVSLTPEGRVGFQLAGRPEAVSSKAASHRAWWLLAGISGHAGETDVPPPPMDWEFITWLADPLDGAATAFWDVLVCLRESNGLHGGLGGSGDPEVYLEGR